MGGDDVFLPVIPHARLFASSAGTIRNYILHWMNNLNFFNNNTLLSLYLPCEKHSVASLKVHAAIETQILNSPKRGGGKDERICTNDSKIFYETLHLVT